MEVVTQLNQSRHPRAARAQGYMPRKQRTNTAHCTSCQRTSVEHNIRGASSSSVRHVAFQKIWRTGTFVPTPTTRTRSRSSSVGSEAAMPADTLAPGSLGFGQGRGWGAHAGNKCTVHLPIRMTLDATTVCRMPHISLLSSISTNLNLQLRVLVEDHRGLDRRALEHGQIPGMHSPELRVTGYVADTKHALQNFEPVPSHQWHVWQATVTRTCL